MPIQDALLRLARGLVCTPSPRDSDDSPAVTDGVRGGVLDTGAPGGNLANNDIIAGNRQLWLVMHVTTAITGVGTPLVELISSASANLGTPTVHLSRSYTDFSTLTENSYHVIGMISTNRPTLRYIGIRISASTSIAAGVIDAWLTPDVQAGQPQGDPL